MTGGDERRQPRPGGAAAGASSDHTGAELFGLLWETMADVLGTAATATLLRRALKRAVPRSAELGGIAIDRTGLAYEYRVPQTWQETRDGDALDALRQLVRDLEPLLVEMTGPVVVRRLARVVPLRRLGLEHGEEQTT